MKTIKIIITVSEDGALTPEQVSAYEQLAVLQVRDILAPSTVEPTQGS
ncbi:MAG: hypothetical protein AB1698_01585 [Pseudomonadota bacterium]